MQFISRTEQIGEKLYIQPEQNGKDTKKEEIIKHSLKSNIAGNNKLETIR
jgi:hypothetical protein